VGGYSNQDDFGSAGLRQADRVGQRTLGKLRAIEWNKHRTKHGHFSFHRSRWCWQRATRSVNAPRPGGWSSHNPVGWAGEVCQCCSVTCRLPWAAFGATNSQDHVRERTSSHERPDRTSRLERNGADCADSVPSIDSDRAALVAVVGLAAVKMAIAAVVPLSA